MRRAFRGRGLMVAAVMGVGAWVGARAQMHKVSRPEKVVRAVGVYEWTGELGHPTASRLIPVSLFIEGDLQDAGVYLARPIPFALDPGTEYELDAAGVAKGDLALETTAHVQTPDDAYTDGWIGYGSFRAPVVAMKTTTGKGKPARVSGSMEVAETNGAKPKFASRSEDATKGKDGGAGAAGGASGSSGAGSSTTGSSTTAASGPGADPDRPTMKRRTGGEAGDGSASPSTASSGGGAAGGTTTGGTTTGANPNGAGSSGTTTTGTAGGGTTGTGSTTGTSGGTGTDASTTADDNRPTMRRRDSADSAGGSDAGSGTGTGSGTDSTTADEADRPTLKRRTPEQAADAKKEKKRKQQTASVTGVGSLNDDPDRPVLHRGGAGDGGAAEIPKLVGTPADLRQMVAVSDAAKRTEHAFARAWGGEDERMAVMAKMRGLAATQMAGYVQKSGGAGKAASVGAASAGAGAPAGGTVAARRAAASAKAAAAKAAAAKAAPVLEDEDLRGFLLSYGGSPTFVYTAHTGGMGDALRYVTVVAQAGPGGELQQAMASVTDAAHLDRTPWLRLVDAVDAEASNRASLLFELRGQTSRQFALYRVLGGRSDQVFATGTTQ